MGWAEFNCAYLISSVILTVNTTYPVDQMPPRSNYAWSKNHTFLRDTRLVVFWIVCTATLTRNVSGTKVIGHPCSSALRSSCAIKE